MLESRCKTILDYSREVANKPIKPSPQPWKKTFNQPKEKEWRKEQPTQRCYKCNKPGHIRKDCRVRLNAYAAEENLILWACEEHEEEREGEEDEEENF
jgi:hypothetical protein